MAFCPTPSSFRNSRRVTTGTALLLHAPPVQKLPGRRQTHIKPCQRWGRRRLPPLGELHTRRHQNQLSRARGTGHPKQGQQDCLCFMTPVRDWSQQHPDLGGYTLPKASVILVYTTRLLYDPGFFLQACKIETAYPSPFSGPVTIS